MRIDAIVLAAGQSRRMGFNKLLMAVHDHPMIEYALLLAGQDCFYQTYVITGCDEVRTLVDRFSYLQNIPVMISNACPERGQSYSVKLGAQKAEADGAAMMFFMGDMPYLHFETVTLLIETYRQENKIIVPVYGHRPGNPVIFPYRYCRQLQQLTGDHGGRVIIKENPEDVYYVRIHDTKQGEDIDTLDDLRR